MSKQIASKKTQDPKTRIQCGTCFVAIAVVGNLDLNQINTSDLKEVEEELKVSGAKVELLHSYP